jgi:hypothetical protein
MTSEQLEGWLKARIAATAKARKKYIGTPRCISLGGKLTALKSVLDFIRSHS